VRSKHIGVDLIFVALPFGRLCYAGPDTVANAIGYAKFRSRSHHAVIRVYDDAGNVIETHVAYARCSTEIDGMSSRRKFLKQSGASVGPVQNRSCFHF
jgi:hypothetical protein